MRAPRNDISAQTPQMIDSIKSAIDLGTPTLEAIASSPKVATAVAAGTASLGAAANLELIRGAFSVVSMAVGTLTTIVVLAIQIIKLVRVWRAWNANLPEPKDLS